jgi:small subunit ribosomal protein S21
VVDAGPRSRYSQEPLVKGLRVIANRPTTRPIILLGFWNFGARMVKLTVRERESIQEAVRRFRKLVERSGIKKEMRKREFFEKPSETKRRARLRAERRTKRNRLLGV